MMTTAERFTFGTPVWVELETRKIIGGIVVACDGVGITIARDDADTQLIPWARIWNVTTSPTVVEAAMPRLSEAISKAERP